MPVIARELDVSERRRITSLDAQNVAAGTYKIEIIPGAHQIDAVRVAATGLTTTPTLQLIAQRFIAGAGLTNINIGSALTLQALGTSGVQTYVLPAAGSSLLQLAEGDILSVTTASGGVTALSVACVVRTLQDIKSFFSVAP
ncbi:hypothetical protein [Microcystis sp. M061S2]|uniref:hypothetical protein n=1 Tax=Microcystis sp. M061S2 TaxID=2771171 RepID=UPI00259110D1|nr:hypothetical protein [Microcystis sp. M061S2]MCA2656865.1 hypothetical protein [Microcystis sp. M061S2]